MPLTRCHHCRKLQLVGREMIGKEIGCLRPSCQRNFTARETSRHQGVLSQMVFYVVIGFALYLAANYFAGEYVASIKQFIYLAF